MCSGACQPRKRDCYADEHYVPVLLASLGLDNETTCNGNTVHVSWQSGSGARWEGFPLSIHTAAGCMCRA